TGPGVAVETSTDGNVVGQAGKTTGRHQRGRGETVEGDRSVNGCPDGAAGAGEDVGHGGRGTFERLDAVPTGREVPGPVREDPVVGVGISGRDGLRVDDGRGELLEQVFLFDE